MKLFKTLLFLTLLALAVPKPALADSHFDISLTPDEIVFQSLPSDPNTQRTTHLTFNVETDSSQTVFPVVLNYNPYTGSYATSGTWTTLSSDPVLIEPHQDNPINFSITPPSYTDPDLYNGQYYRIVGLSSQPFTDSQSDNPPIIVGIPVVIQIYGTKTYVFPQGPNISVPPSAPYQPPGWPTSLPKISLPFLNQANQNIPIEIGRPTNQHNLLSALYFSNFKTFYNPLNQTVSLGVRIKNTGNISSTPSGFIEIINNTGAVISKIEINPHQQEILPQGEKEFSYIYKPTEDLLGNFQAQLWLGYTSSIQEIAPKPISTAYFYYLPPNVVGSVLASLALTIAVVKIPKKKLKRRVQIQYLGIIVILGILGGVIFLDLHQIKINPRILGQESIGVSANVGSTIGADVSIAENQKTVNITSTSPKGTNVYLLGGGFLTLVESFTNFPFTPLVISGANNRKPILILTRNF